MEVLVVKSGYKEKKKKERVDVKFFCWLDICIFTPENQFEEQSEHLSMICQA